MRRPLSINPFARLANIQEKQRKQADPYSKKELRHFVFSQDPNLLKAVRAFSKAIQQLPQDPHYPHTKPQAFLSGGFVRDAILGLQAKDADIEVYGVSPKNLLAVLNQLYPNVSLVGESFAVIKVSVSSTITLDISLPRRERKFGHSRKDFEIESDPGMTPEEASHRRDFTINALLANPHTGEIFDFHHGLQDIHDRVLRITDPLRFEEDELRVLRGIQFATRMNLQIEPTTWAQFLTIIERGDMQKLSADRVRDELIKLLTKSIQPSKGIELLRDLGILKQEYPVFARIAESASSTNQTWNNLLRRLDTAATYLQQEQSKFTEKTKIRILFAALCADITNTSTNVIRTSIVKPETMKGKYQSPVASLLTRSWNMSQDDTLAILGALREYQQPLAMNQVWQRKIIDDQNYANFVRMMLKRLYPESITEVLALAEIEWQTTMPYAANSSYLPTEKLQAIVQEYQLDQIDPRKTLLTGSELQELGVPTGPQIGSILQHIENLRDAGAIVTHDEALSEAKRYITE